jgi:hypothetical protein
VTEPVSSGDVRSLARLHLALGAADGLLPAPAPSRARRGLAAFAVAILCAGATLGWSSSVQAAVAERPAGVDEPAATLPGKFSLVDDGEPAEDPEEPWPSEPGARATV